jgi:hypothetical protein
MSAAKRTDSDCFDRSGRYPVERARGPGSVLIPLKSETALNPALLHASEGGLGTKPPAPHIALTWTSAFHSVSGRSTQPASRPRLTGQTPSSVSATVARPAGLSDAGHLAATRAAPAGPPLAKTSLTDRTVTAGCRSPSSRACRRGAATDLAVRAMSGLVDRVSPPIDGS